ncbi:tol-pal system YbgF family protein [Candidatus Margulisiibacteriota bacterium]
MPSKKTIKNDLMPKKAKIWPLMAVAGISAIVAVIIFTGVLQTTNDSNKLALEDPMDTNDIIIPIIARALVLNMPQGYEAAIENIKNNEEYIKNKYSLKLSIAELYYKGLNDQDKAKAIYEELVKTYKNEKIKHIIVELDKGYVRKKKIFLMSISEVLMRLAELNYVNNETAKAKELYKKIISKYSKDVFGQEELKYYYKELAEYNLKAIGKSHMQIIDTDHEIEKLQGLENRWQALQLACISQNEESISNQIKDKQLIISIKEEDNVFGAASIIKAINVGRGTMADFIKEVLQKAYARRDLQYSFNFAGIAKGRVKYEMLIKDTNNKKLAEVTFYDQNNRWQIAEIKKL